MCCIVPNYTLALCYETVIKYKWLKKEDASATAGTQSPNCQKKYSHTSPLSLMKRAGVR